MRIGLCMLAVLGCVACAAETAAPATTEPQRVSDLFPDVAEAALREWGATFGAASCALPYVAIVPQAQAEQLCRAGDTLYACTMLERSTIVLESAYDADQDPHVAHELMHWLAYCTGLHADGDLQHADPLIWQQAHSWYAKAGVLERVVGDVAPK